MSAQIVLMGTPPADSLEALETWLADWGYRLQQTTSLKRLTTLVRDAHPVAVLTQLSSDTAAADIYRALMASGQTPQVIALNPDGLPGRLSAVAAGFSTVLDYPLNQANLKACLNTPLNADGHPLTVGSLFGRTPSEVNGTADLLAHDLKSPISLIISSLEVFTALYESDATEDVTRLLHGSLHAAYRQMHLVNDLIDLARLEMHTYRLDMAPTDVCSAVQEGLEAERYGFETKGLALSVDLPSPLIVPADRELLIRAVIAILVNSLKFTVRGDTLAVSAVRHNASIELRFTDSGRPIQPGLEEEIVKRAPQLSERQSGTRTSVAVGLPFVRAVALAHGGSFGGRTASETGLTTFSLILPTNHQSERS